MNLFSTRPRFAQRSNLNLISARRMEGFVKAMIATTHVLQPKMIEGRSHWYTIRLRHTSEFCEEDPTAKSFVRCPSPSARESQIRSGCSSRNVYWPHRRRETILAPMTESRHPECRPAACLKATEKEIQDSAWKRQNHRSRKKHEMPSNIEPSRIAPIETAVSAQNM